MDKDNNNSISDSTLQNVLPPQLKNMTSQYKVMCGCDYCISSKCMHLSLLSWHEDLKNLNIKYVIHRKEGLLKFPIIYFIHIKIIHGTW